MNAWNRFYQELVSFDIGTDAKKMISKLVIVNFIILFVITFFWVWGFVPLLIYSLIIYFLLKKYVYDIQTKYQNLLQRDQLDRKRGFRYRFFRRLRRFRKL